MATSRLSWTLSASDLRYAHGATALEGPVLPAGLANAGSHDHEPPAAARRHAESIPACAGEAAPPGARRGVQKRRFRRPSGKSAFQRDIEVR